MTATKGTTSAPESASNTFTFDRPADINPGAWEYRQALALRALAGHYPWCTDHQDVEGEVDWCSHKEWWPRLGTAILNNGTGEGRVAIQMDFDDSINLDELTMEQAARLGAMFKKVSEMGMAYNAAVIR